MQPDLAAKEAAWAAVLSSDEPARIAQASAAGIWVPGQEQLMTGYRDRYFTEVLPALRSRATPRTTVRSSRFPLPPESARPARPRPQVPYRIASASRSIWSGEDVVG